MSSVSCLIALAGCSDQASTGQGSVGNNQNQGYRAGDGSVERIPPSDRAIAITLTGSSLEGDRLDTSSWRGDFVVINTWGSWCPPCNAEAPTLAAVAKQYAGRGVQFVGVNLREGPQTGLAFQRRFGVGYPSVVWDGGKTVLQLRGKAPATPTTLIIDPNGNLAARIVGETQRSTLTGLLDDLLAESPPPTGSPSPVGKPQPTGAG